MGAITISVHHEPVPLTTEFLIGRARMCCLRVSKDTVSPYHAELSWRQHHWALRDLASDRGTYINGKRVTMGTTTPLSPGDRVGLGGPTPTFVFDDDAPPNPARSSQTPPTPTLTLRVTSDEEFVEPHIEGLAATHVTLAPRSHFYTLLTLARVWRGDRERPVVSTRQGWRYVSTFCDMLKIDDARLNVDIYRISP